MKNRDLLIQLLKQDKKPLDIALETGYAIPYILKMKSNLKVILNEKVEEMTYDNILKELIVLYDVCIDNELKLNILKEISNTKILIHTNKNKIKNG